MRAHAPLAPEVTPDAPSVGAERVDADQGCPHGDGRVEVVASPAVLVAAVVALVVVVLEPQSAALVCMVGAGCGLGVLVAGVGVDDGVK